MSLIEELEKAEGPSPLLDKFIGISAGEYLDRSNHGEGMIAHKDAPNAIFWQAPPYTSSIDAALTLVPEGRLWTLDPASNEEWECSLYHEGTRIWHDEDTTSVAATPAIAICIAALRARETTNGTT